MELRIFARQDKICRQNNFGAEDDVAVLIVSLRSTLQKIQATFTRKDKAGKSFQTKPFS